MACLVLNFPLMAVLFLWRVSTGNMTVQFSLPGSLLFSSPRSVRYLSVTWSYTIQIDKDRFCSRTINRNSSDSTGGDSFNSVRSKEWTGQFSEFSLLLGWHIDENTITNLVLTCLGSLVILCLVSLLCRVNLQASILPGSG